MIKLGIKLGGERGIRTLDTVSRIHAFQACAFSHSATPPHAAGNLADTIGNRNIFTAVIVG